MPPTLDRSAGREYPGLHQVRAIIVGAHTSAADRPGATLRGGLGRNAGACRPRAGASGLAPRRGDDRRGDAPRGAGALRSRAGALRRARLRRRDRRPRGGPRARASSRVPVRRGAGQAARRRLQGRGRALPAVLGHRSSRRAGERDADRARALRAAHGRAPGGGGRAPAAAAAAAAPAACPVVARRLGAEAVDGGGGRDRRRHRVPHRRLRRAQRRRRRRRLRRVRRAASGGGVAPQRRRRRARRRRHLWPWPASFASRWSARERRARGGLVVGPGTIGLGGTF